MKVNLSAVLALLHQGSFGTLTTHSTQLPGYPFGSLAPYALDEAHRPLFLISGLAEHTRNLQADARSSLLVAESGSKNVLAGSRLTLLGDAAPCEPEEALVERYLRYHPEGRRYLDLGDFRFYRLSPRRARFVAGFGEMGWIEEADWQAVSTLPLADEKALHHELGALLPAGTRLLGLDAYGIDLERNSERERLGFSSMPTSIQQLESSARRVLAAL
ncbi:hypothetical protein SAMN06265795_13217 [Noviherbaspirillum humi]|uniref:CREG-like beta-barrel domain-containing protein n=1 Tax=Noviherbaspirillum humi TaxID=1688639 RepID=A0A239M5C3_9BURK|nr:pyridoxamine 5'-phosphate oxidase family protein [Noviherbaspirillum humi]SNT37895.1 hypothetical protein SAMN06265795_13217 [Noviherbaspirillum humi]